MGPELSEPAANSKKQQLALDAGLLLLRVWAGGTMLASHGLKKMEKIFGEGPIEFADPIGVGEAASLALAVFAEVGCGFALVVGLLTRLSTFPLIVTMAVAFFVVHADDPFGRKELAFVYLLSYVAIALTGPGRFSVDAKLWPWWRARRAKQA